MRSAFSADGRSTMSQPVSRLSAPMLAALRRNNRRDGPGSSLPASLTRRPLSTSGARLQAGRMFPPSAAADHGAQTPGHEEGHDDMDDEEQDHRCHGEEMHPSCAFVAAEQGGQLLQLHGLPNGEAGGNDDDAG